MSPVRVVVFLVDNARSRWFAGCFHNSLPLAGSLFIVMILLIRWSSPRQAPLSTRNWLGTVPVCLAGPNVGANPTVLFVSITL